MCPPLVTTEYLLVSLSLAFDTPQAGVHSLSFNLYFVDYAEESGPLCFPFCDFLSLSFAQFSTEVFLLTGYKSLSFFKSNICLLHIANIFLPVCYLPVIFMASLVLPKVDISL